MLLIRSIFFYVGYIISLIFFGLLSLPLLLLPNKTAAAIILYWNHFVIFWLKICCGIHLHIEGDIKKIKTPCVIVANHQSPLETIFLQLYFKPLTTVLKQELLNIPFFGWGLRILKPIAIDRSNPVQALKQVKKMGIERLQQGYNVLIFPEGTRQPVEQLGNFTRSGADIAKSAGVPLVAIAHNAGHYWHNKKFIKHPGMVRIIVSDAIMLEDANTKEEMQRIKEWVELKL